MDIATKLELLPKEIVEASYYGGIESRVMGKWADFKELCDEHKRLVRERTAAACAEWFRVEQKPSVPEPSNIEAQKAFETWILGTYDTVSMEYGRLVGADARVASAIGHAHAGWFAALNWKKGN